MKTSIFLKGQRSETAKGTKRDSSQITKKLDNSLNPYSGSVEKMPDLVKTPDTKLPLSFKM